MQLKDCLKGKVKIGANNGSGFIWCGTVKDDIWSILDDETKKSYKSLKTDLKQAEKRVKSQIDYVKRVKPKYKESEKDRLKQLVEIRYMLKDFYENFKPLQDREVVEIYDSVYEYGVDIIIIKGNERGKWWTCAECERGWIDK